MEETVLDLDAVIENLLWTLHDGRAYTAVELANYNGIDKDRAGSILNQLIEEGKLEIEQHRFCYYRLIQREEMADDAVYHEKPKIYPLEWPLPPIKYCRSCHGHLAGKVGVEVAHRLQEKRYIVKEKQGLEYIFHLTSAGAHFFEALGINVTALRNKPGKLAKACLDFSERKHHLGGRLGVAFLDKMIELDWFIKKHDSRIKIPTQKGKRVLSEQLGVIWD